MRKALFRKDLWKDVGPKKDADGAEAEDVKPEQPRLHQHYYKYTRRVRLLSGLQIVTGTFLYFVSIFLPVFGARGYYTEYLIPMGSVSGPCTVVAGIFARETCRNRRSWMIIVYMILCFISAVCNFVQFIGACAAFGKEARGYAEDIITEHVIAAFRYLSYMIMIFLTLCIMTYAVMSVVMDLRWLSPRFRECCTYSWMFERNIPSGDNNNHQEAPVTTV